MAKPEDTVAGRKGSRDRLDYAYRQLVGESVVCQKQAARLMYTLQTEGSANYTPADISRMHGLLENVTSIMGAILKDEDRSRLRRDVG